MALSISASGVLPMTRLTNLHKLNCSGDNGPGEAKPDSLEPSLASEAANGAFYQPERSGEGWFLEYLGNGRALVQWFTYNLQDKQAWLTGVGRVEGSRVIVDQMIYVTGTEFGAAFNSDDVGIQIWGDLEIGFDDCNNGRISYSSEISGWGQGEADVTRLTKISGISCDWPFE